MKLKIISLKNFNFSKDSWNRISFYAPIEKATKRHYTRANCFFEIPKEKKKKKIHKYIYTYTYIYNVYNNISSKRAFRLINDLLPVQKPSWSFWHDKRNIAYSCFVSPIFYHLFREILRGKEGKKQKQKQNSEFLLDYGRT